MFITKENITNFLTESVDSAYNESYEIAKVFQESYDNGEKIIFEDTEKTSVLEALLPMKDKIDFILENSNISLLENFSFESYKIMESYMPNTLNIILEGKGNEFDKQEYEKLMSDIKEKTEDVRKSKNKNDCLRLSTWITLACSSALIWIPYVNVVGFIGSIAAGILAIITMSNDHKTRTEMRKNLDKLEASLDKIKDRDSYDRANEKIKKLRQELQNDEGWGKYNA
jgi:hypothetical protein